MDIVFTPREGTDEKEVKGKEYCLMNNNRPCTQNYKFTGLLLFVLAGMVYPAGQQQVPVKKAQAVLLAAPQIISILPTDMNGVGYVSYQGKFIITGKNFSADPAENKIGIRTYMGPNPQIPPPPQEFVAEVIPLTATPEKLEAIAPPIASKGKYWVWVYVEGGGQSNPMAANFDASAGPSGPGPGSGGMISISGYWISNIGAIYDFDQTGNQFTWREMRLEFSPDKDLLRFLQMGKGTISGKAVAVSGSNWTINGTVTEVDTLGRATRITGENAVILSRTTKGASPDGNPVGAVPGLPPSGTFDISGQWYSNIGAVYEFQQIGELFAWSAPGLNQSGIGMISERAMILNGPGWTVKGTITEVDPAGKATKIVGENGVILFRK
jgi:hypothetical protein